MYKTQHVALLTNTTETVVLFSSVHIWELFSDIHQPQSLIKNY